LTHVNANWSMEFRGLSLLNSNQWSS